MKSIFKTAFETLPQNGIMKKITCISEEKDIYKKGDIVFRISLNKHCLCNCLEVDVVNEEGEYCLVTSDEFKNMKYRILDLFPMLSRTDIRWNVVRAPCISDDQPRGHIRMYTTYNISSTDIVIRHLSDTLDEESPLTYLELKQDMLKDHAAAI